MSSAVWEISVRTKPHLDDPRGRAVAAETASLGLADKMQVRFSQLYLLEGSLDRAGAQRAARELLSDPVCEEFAIAGGDGPTAANTGGTVTVYLQPGVMDPAAESVEASLRDMGLPPVSARTARRYELSPVPPEPVLRQIARRVLSNDCIETVVFGSGAPPSAHAGSYEFKLRTVPIRELSDADLLELSRRGHLSLNLTEMRTIQAHFRTLGREPTDAELETVAQTWSEHCVHKTLKGMIRYRETRPDGSVREETIDNLLASTIARATRELNKDWCVSVFKDNAGIIRFDERFNVTFKVETHNRPSAIEPYGGSATGIGGCIRDTMGTGLGAKPIVNTDVFCFAPPNTPLDKLPKGVLPPQKVIRGVVAGVRDYGNRMGIPTANGAVFFDDRYLGNPLVFCGSVGLIPAEWSFKKVNPGDRIFVAGGRTGRDGIHGATFSSGELDHASESVFSHAVQIGNAITEKKLLDGLLRARDRHLYSAVTDCGAGGLSSACGEMGEHVGAKVELDKVPLKYQGLSYTEIWISEAQERMVLSVPPEKADELRAVFAAEGVEATDIGVFGHTGADGRPELELRFRGHTVGKLGMSLLHEGVPRFLREAEWKAPHLCEPDADEIAAALPGHRPDPRAPGKPVPPFNDVLRKLLGSWNICSKEWIIRQYDHEVQGGSAIKPLVGEREDGPGDACVVRPVIGSRRGIAVANGMNPCYGDIDPYWMALAGIDEAVRNIVAVGGDPARTAILDNFSWGNCAKPDRLGGLVRAARACLDGALAYGTPFISGKDSLNNEFALEDGRTIVIPPSLLISAIALIDDVTRCVTMDAKAAGNLVYIVGTTRDELGGSHYYRVLGKTGANVPKVDLQQAPRIAAALHAAINSGLVRSAHDLSEGGLAVALAEMAFAGGFGAAIDLRRVPAVGGLTRADTLLFSESCTRWLIEVEPKKADALSAALAGIPHACLGRFEHEPWLVVHGLKGETLIEDELSALKESWQKPLRW